VRVEDAAEGSAAVLASCCTPCALATVASLVDDPADKPIISCAGLRQGHATCVLLTVVPPAMHPFEGSVPL
jgi:hypothetical protein